VIASSPLAAFLGNKKGRPQPFLESVEVAVSILIRKPKRIRSGSPASTSLRHTATIGRSNNAGQCRTKPLRNRAGLPLLFLHKGRARPLPHMGPARLPPHTGHGRLPRDADHGRLLLRVAHGRLRTPTGCWTREPLH